MSGPDTGGATVWVAPLGAGPPRYLTRADRRGGWTPLTGVESSELTFAPHPNDARYHLITGSFTRHLTPVPVARYPSCAHPGFTRALTQKGDTDGLPPRRD